jgi:hypothetical protein
VQKKRPRGLDNGHAGHHPQQEMAQMEGRVLKQALAHGDMVGERDATSPEVKKQAGVGHDAQAAQLDEHQDHGLAESAEGRAGIHHGESRDAGGRGGGEQGVQKGDSRTGVACGTAQKRRAEEDGSGEDVDGQGHGRQEFSGGHGGGSVGGTLPQVGQETKPLSGGVAKKWGAVKAPAQELKERSEQ